MNKKQLWSLLVVVWLLVLAVLAGCATDADVASTNVSKAADNFEVMRRVVFYNGINGEYILEVVGLCSLGNYDDPSQLSITCKVGPDQFKKHFLGRSDNVTYFAEQIDPIEADAYHYRVTFKPSTIVPDIDLRTP